MNESELKALCNAVVAELSDGKAAANPQLASGLLDIIGGLKTKGLNWISILQYLPVIISAIQTLGPKIQEIIELISALIDGFKPSPVPPVVKP